MKTRTLISGDTSMTKGLVRNITRIFRRPELLFLGTVPVFGIVCSGVALAQSDASSVQSTATDSTAATLPGVLISLFKPFPITERVNLCFNADTFIALNMEGFNNPNKLRHTTVLAASQWFGQYAAPDSADTAAELLRIA